MLKHICSERENSYKLNPRDQYMDSRKCIIWTHFYNYDISSERLEKALETIAEIYPILCGRLSRDEITGMKVEVQSGKGFQFVEMNGDFTLLEAISKARVTNQVADFPSLAQLPFFMADMDCHTFYDKESPVFSMKLVHYKDNTCSLAVAMRHFICDGKRLTDLLIDLARAYCDQPLRKVDHDRSRLWPDVFLHKVDIDLSPQDFPRRINFNLEVKSNSIPGETYSIESIYFPKEGLETLKAKVMERLKEEGSYVSMSDIVASVRWMLQCELNAVREGTLHSVKTSLDLRIAGTCFRFPKDFVSEDSKLLPSNYFGNGFIAELSLYPERKTEHQRSCSLFNTLVTAAQAIRKKILAKRSDSFVASDLMIVYEGRGNPETSSPFDALLSSLHKMPFDKINFQGGPPVYNYVPPTYPFYPGRGTLSTLGNGKGMILNILVPTGDLKNATSSDVLKELCPEARFVCQMTSLQFCECC